MGVKAHVFHPVMLDGGTHFCLVCRATDTELAPVCPGSELSTLARNEQKVANAQAYGGGKWLITVYIGTDVRVDTLVMRGVTVAP